MSDEPDTDHPQSPTEGDYAAALAELLACETLAQTAGWAARWLAALAGADAALVWTQDPIHPVFVCTGSSGEGLGRILQQSVPRSDGFVRRLIRDREAFSLNSSEILVSDDPWLPPGARSFGRCLALPLDAEGGVIGVAAVLFRNESSDPATALEALSTFVPDAAQSVARSLKQDKKTSGMLHAIERLTNLYDLSKAFGSTLDWDELTAIIARKAVDFANAEAASLWVLQGSEGEVALAATAINENYEIAHPPDSIGATIVGEALSAREAAFENDLPEEHFLRKESSFPVSSYLTLPLLEDEETVGVIIIANKRGRRPRFEEADGLLLTDLGHQAVRALHNARRYGAERRVEELDALLAVSREITSTLDLDRVMKTVANASAALVDIDRCSVAVVQRGKLKLGAVSGVDEINRSDPSIARTAALLEWVYGGGTDVSVTRQDDGKVVADRAETAEKFRVFFEASGMRSYLAMILQDEEGKLGAISFEGAELRIFGDESRDLLQILINQATVALRNAQLYQQVPLAGFWKPLLEKQRQLAAIPKYKLRRRLAIGGAVLLALIVLPWNIRLTGPARVLPGRRMALTAPVPGVIASVLHREGDTVKEGDIVATLDDNDYQAAAAQAKADFDIARNELSQDQASGDTSDLAKATAHLEETRARYAVAEGNLAQTKIRAPAAGVLITPHLEDRVGQMLASGAELAVLADTRSAEVEVEVREVDASLLREGEDIKVKLNSYPSQVFHGKIGRVSPVVRQEGDDRFILADAALDNGGGEIRPGMLGNAKISTGTRRLGYAVLRKPARWLWAKFWPLMP
ncbi:MAG: efflux RND transporter periplasmic adaptor subunit [Thermoanaerobaculia bacterium]